jgi:hypothetical protein
MQETRRDCPCKKLKCPRHGDCAACRLHHATGGKYPPFCDRPGKKVKKPDAQKG